MFRARVTAIAREQIINGTAKVVVFNNAPSQHLQSGVYGPGYWVEAKVWVPENDVDEHRRSGRQI